VVIVMINLKLAMGFVKILVNIILGLRIMRKCK